MPRFFFHVQDGPFYADELGTELPDQIRARNVALEILSHLVRSAADDLWHGSAFCVFAEDEQGAPLFTLEVRALPASAGKGATSAQN
jgi:hypothetical protein